MIMQKCKAMQRWQCASDCVCVVFNFISWMSSFCCSWLHSFIFSHDAVEWKSKNWNSFNCQLRSESQRLTIGNFWLLTAKGSWRLWDFYEKFYYGDSQVFSHFYSEHRRRCTLSKSGMLISSMARPKIRRSCWIDSTWQLSQDRCKKNLSKNLYSWTSFILSGVNVKDFWFF